LAGETHYSIGRSCKHGHSDKYYVCHGRCFECDAIWHKQYLAARPGKMAERARKQRANDPTSHRKASLKWAKQNPHQNKAIKGRCIARNPDLWRKRFVAYSQNRKARETQNGGSFTDTDIDAMRAKQNGKCNACKKERKLEVDHIVPVVNGGSNDPSNLQLLCARCNKSKGRRDYDVWLAEQVFDLPVENAA
jgi:5-methylcytosine-specific restriction endonuclease McrA